MSDSMWGAGKVDGGDKPRRDHPQPRFMVSLGWEYRHVHCPLCLATGDGWWPSGAPKYKGGLIRCLTEASGAWVHTMAACRCFVGDEIHNLSHLTYFDRLPRLARYLSRPGLVLWVQGQAEKPIQPSLDNDKEFSERCLAGYQKVISKDMTQEEYETVVDLLTEKLMPPMDVRPTIEDVMGSNLKGVYLGHELPVPSAKRRTEPYRSPYKED